MTQNIKVNFFFWASYFLLIFTEMFNNISLVEKYSTYITLIALIGLVIFILIKNESYRLKFFFFFSFLVILSVMSFYRLRDFTFLKFLILLLSLRSISFSTFVKYDLRIRILMFIGVFLCSCLGLCEVTSFIRGNVTRYTLGFIHPNSAGFYLLLLSLEYMYLNKDNKKKRIFLFPVLACFIIHFITNSRTSLIVLIFAIVFCWIIKYGRKSINILESRFVQFLSCHLFLIFTLCTVGLIVLYSHQNVLAIKINNNFSNRLNYFSFFWNRYSINLLGNNLTTYYVLDNTYLQLLLRFGLITYVFYYVLYVKRMKLAFSRKEYVLIVIFISMLLYGLMENSALKSTYNIFLLSFSDVLFKRKDVDLQ